MVQMPSTTNQERASRLMLDIDAVKLTDEQFYRLCADSPDLRIELTAARKLVVMSPTGCKTGWRNSKVNQRLANWSDRDASGICFDSSTGFTLPNGAKRSPDAARVRLEVWETLTAEQQEEFASICPDFVVELCSPGDSLDELQEKMEEYIGNGARLGWLFDPRSRRVYIYRPHQHMICVDSTQKVSGDPVLVGFTFDPGEIW
jgi:Uma2 family endonuclease